MTDIDRAITQALASAADRFAPTDLAVAEERFLRRRRKRRFTWFGAATLATAAALVAVVLLPRAELAQNDEPLPVAGAVMTTVAVGESPVSIASTATAVWVANSGDGTVSRIDPDTREVVATIELGGSPEEVAIDEFASRPTVWVYDAEARRIVEIQPSTNTVGFQYSDEWPEGTHLDLAVKDVTTWMADPATATVYVDYRGQPPRGQPAYFGPKGLFERGLLPERGGDVALESGAGEVWAYNGESGALTLLQDAAGAFERADRPDITDVLTSENGDLAVGGQALWVSDDFGVIMRIDRRTHEKEYVDVGGRYSNLSYGGGYLWALTANEEDDGTATLRRIDPTTAEVVGEEILLRDHPADVSADGDAVWVPHASGSSVTRIDVTSPDETPAPEPSESPGAPEAEEPAEGAEIQFAFTANDDVYLEYSDGTTFQLTRTPDIERNPAFGAVSIFYERHDHETDWVGIIEHNFLTGKDRIAAEGTEPAVSYGGDLAYIDGAPGEETLYIARADDRGRLSADHVALPLSGHGLVDFGSLEWSDDGKMLYLQARGEGWVTVQVPATGDVSGAEPFVLNGVTDQPPGATFLQPDNATERSIEVANLCCREVEGAPYTQLSIGRIAFEEGGARYEDLVPNVLEQANLDPADVYVADMHELEYRGEGWEMFSGTRSWIVVADAMHVFLVNERGDVLTLAGAESGPSLLAVPPASRFGAFDLNPSLEGDLRS